MNSEQYDEGLPRNVKLLGLMYLLYAIVIPVIVFIGEPDIPASSEPFFLYWLMLFLMPLEILLIYLFYRVYSKRSKKIKNLIGPAILMYTLGIVPSIYGWVIGLTDNALRNIAILLGLTFSIAGFGLAFYLLPKLNETIKATNQ